MTDAQQRLSKSRFVAGVQCPKLLWWKVHEPDAVELQPDTVLQDRFDQGQAVGELATTLFPGGVLIDLPHDAVEERIGQTLEAISGDAPAIFELYDMIRIRALVLAVAFILSLAGCLAAPPQNAVDAAVTRVIDGDTFEARLPSGEADPDLAHAAVEAVTNLAGQNVIGALGARIDTLESKIDVKFDAIESKIDVKFDVLRRDMDRTVRHTNRLNAVLVGLLGAGVIGGLLRLFLFVGA